MKTWEITREKLTSNYYYSSIKEFYHYAFRALKSFLSKEGANILNASQRRGVKIFGRIGKLRGGAKHFFLDFVLFCKCSYNTFFLFLGISGTLKQKRGGQKCLDRRLFVLIFMSKGRTKNCGCGLGGGAKKLNISLRWGQNFFKLTRFAADQVQILMLVRHYLQSL